MAAELIAAYGGARYRIEAPEGAFTVVCSECHAGLERLLAAAGARSAALITAHNPRGRRADPSANTAAEAALGAAIADLGLESLVTAGVDPNGVWPEELGRLIFDIGRAAAIDIAARFGQDAILWCAVGAAPELVLLR
ncbi:DUF3293 domain-containing protein [Siculibacillus lacustris]|uniref:DUF3293 domain-containing protein n=1 Tax=Siculibacillus lacustris TaxID=1549641 RepID=UPI0013F17CFF|nr:DUF3293 domain-containing protein [Siculibacillus lacustris]